MEEKPKVREIRSYFELMEQKLQGLEAKKTEIWTTIRESRPRSYRLSAGEKFELKMLMRDIKSDLQITEDYYKEADRALKSLQSELETDFKKEGVSSVGESACGVAKEILMRGQWQMSCVAAVMLGAVLGGVEGVFSISRKYEACMTEINGLQSDLSILRIKIRENYALFDNFDMIMGDLNVVQQV